MIRAFFAIPVGKIEASNLEKQVLPLKKTLKEQVRWTEKGMMHITIKFFDAIDSDALIKISEVARELSQTLSAFTLAFDRIDLFPSSFGTLLAAYLIPDAKLTLLFNSLNQAGERAGLKLETRPFRPHVTLARLKTTLSNYKSISCSQLTLHATELVLYESKPTAEGSNYIPLQCFHLL